MLETALLIANQRRDSMTGILVGGRSTRSIIGQQSYSSGPRLAKIAMSISLGDNDA